MAGHPEQEVCVFYTSQKGRWRPEQMAKDYFNNRLLSNYNERYQDASEQEQRQRQKTDLSLRMFLQKRNLQCYLIHSDSLCSQHIALSEKIPNRYLLIWVDVSSINTKSTLFQLWGVTCFQLNTLTQLWSKCQMKHVKKSKMNMKLAFINYLKNHVLPC